MANDSEKIPLLCRLQWVVLRLSGIELSPMEAKQRRYFPGKKIDFVETKLKPDEIEAQYKKAALLFDIEQKRRDVLTDKVKTLLSLGTFSLTFSVALFSLIDFQSKPIPLIVLLGTSATICILLCLNFLSINTYSTPAFESKSDNPFHEQYDLNAESKVANHVEELVNTCDYNHRGTDFLADVYRSAQRYFMVTLICIVAMLVVQPFGLKEKKAVNNTYIFSALPTATKIVDEIYMEFDFDKYAISQNESKKMLAALDKYKNGFEFSIVGYTDKIGPGAYNRTLGSMRASSIAKWLVDNLNVPPRHVSIMGYGITKKYGDDAALPRNRRAVIYVLGSK